MKAASRVETHCLMSALLKVNQQSQSTAQTQPGGHKQKMQMTAGTGEAEEQKSGCRLQAAGVETAQGARDLAGWRFLGIPRGLQLNSQKPGTCPAYTHNSCVSGQPSRRGARVAMAIGNSSSSMLWPTLEGLKGSLCCCPGPNP